MSRLVRAVLAALERCDHDWRPEQDHDAPFSAGCARCGAEAAITLDEPVVADAVPCAARATVGAATAPGLVPLGDGALARPGAAAVA